MIELLKTAVLSDDDFQYIEDYDTYTIGVENYNEKMRLEGELKERKNTVRSMRLKGYSAEKIADILDLELSEVNAFFKQLYDESKSSNSYH
jgi:predicted transposase YdaD